MTIHIFPSRGAQIFHSEHNILRIQISALLYENKFPMQVPIEYRKVNFREREGQKYAANDIANRLIKYNRKGRTVSNR